MSKPTASPDQYLYGRQGPWPQPSPSHPLIEAYEVLTIPPIETLLWNSTIGERYLKTLVGYAGLAAGKAMLNFAYTTPADDAFQRIMLTTAYMRYLNPMSAADNQLLAQNEIPVGAAGAQWKYDFNAMGLVQPLAGMYCAPTVVFFAGAPMGQLVCVAISVNGIVVTPLDSAWGLAKIYALQGAAYHMLFVVHPALHFPMDSVNAITKTAVPHTHPLFQLLYPHTSYTLALDNAVLEGANSVVNENAQGTWFDPLMGNAYNLKLLFGAGYSGLPDKWFKGAYPAFDFMKPQMGFDSPYGQWLKAYFEPFEFLCKAVANQILKADKQDTYVRRWARYNSTYVQGFPDEDEIFKDGCLAQAMAIYMWDVTVSH